MQKTNSIKKIETHLGLDIPSIEREKIIKNIIDQYKNDTMFGVSGKCSDNAPKAYPDHYFLAQKFDGKKEDMRKALQEAFSEFNLDVRTVDREIGGLLLCNIASLIMGTAFGVYHISKEQNRNVYIELGMSIGLRKPFVLVKDADAGIADILALIHYYEMNSYLSLSEEFGNLTNNYITQIGYANESLIPKVSSEKQKVCISLGNLETVDIGVTLAKQMVQYGYQPVFLGKVNRDLIRFLEKNEITPIFHPTLQESAKAIASSKFGIYRVDMSASENSFVNLGISIGLNRPIFMINNVREKPPSDLSLFSSLRYRGIDELNEIFPSEFLPWKERLFETRQETHYDAKG